MIPEYHLSSSELDVGASVDSAGPEDLEFVRN